MADALRGNMDAAEYKHVVLGLIFLKYISDAFEEQHARARRRERASGADPEDPDEYRAAQRSSGCRRRRAGRTCRRSAKQPTIGQLVDDAMDAIERDNPSLKGVLPKDYARPALDKTAARRAHRPGQQHQGRRRGEPRQGRARPRLRVLPRPVRQRRGQEGRRVLHARAAWSSCWSRCSSRTRAACTTPAAAPAACSCSRRSSSARSRERQRRQGQAATSRSTARSRNPTTWRLAKMNLAIRGIDGQIAPRRHLPQRPAPRPEGRLHPGQSALQRLRLGRRALRDDKRWKYGVPPVGNANFAWVQHFIHHLAPTGIAGFVLANGSMSSNQSGEGEIRKSHHRGRPGGLHGGAAGPALLLDADPGLPLVPGARQEERQVPRPPRRDAVHRRPQARHAWSTASTAS